MDYFEKTFLGLVVRAVYELMPTNLGKKMSGPKIFQKIQNDARDW